MSLITNHRNRTLTAIAIVVFILIVDQIIKIAVKTNMALGEQIEVTDWCRICFTENKGMAFGMEYVGTMALSLFRIVAVAFFAYALFNIIKKRAPWGLLVSWAAVVAGAAGNIIDNFFCGAPCFHINTPSVFIDIFILHFNRSSKMKNIKFMHSVWHLFVLAGSILHFFFILFYTLKR